MPQRCNEKSASQLIDISTLRRFSDSKGNRAGIDAAPPHLRLRSSSASCLSVGIASVCLLRHSGLVLLCSSFFCHYATTRGPQSVECQSPYSSDIRVSSVRVHIRLTLDLRVRIRVRHATSPW
jgi:hypothetical protein